MLGLFSSKYIKKIKNYLLELCACDMPLGSYASILVHVRGTRGRSWVSSYITLQLHLFCCFILFLRQGLSLNLELTDSASLIGQQSLQNPVLTSPTLGLQVPVTISRFLLRYWRSNWGSHACTLPIDLELLIKSVLCMEYPTSKMKRQKVREGHVEIKPEETFFFWETPLNCKPLIQNWVQILMLPTLRS